MRLVAVARVVSHCFLAVVLGGCYVEAFTAPDGGSTFDPTNMPVVGVSSDGLGYALRAKDFTSDQQYGPVVQTKTVSVAAAVVGYSRGSATLEIRDATSAIVLQQTVANNVAQGSSLVRGVAPFQVTLSFRHFSGNFSLGIGPGESSESR